MLRFARSFIRHPIATGALAPSSTRLAREMVSWIDWSKVTTCSEFGPGTGAFTGSIIESMNGGTRFFAVELNKQFATTMAEKFPDLETVCRSVVDIREICRERGISSIDCIVCGLPWAAFPSQLQHDLIDAILSCLSNGGYFCTFAYVQGKMLPAGIRSGQRMIQGSRTPPSHVVPFPSRSGLAEPA